MKQGSVKMNFSRSFIKIDKSYIHVHSISINLPKYELKKITQKIISVRYVDGIIVFQTKFDEPVMKSVMDESHRSQRSVSVDRHH